MQALAFGFLRQKVIVVTNGARELINEFGARRTVVALGAVHWTGVGYTITVFASGAGQAIILGLCARERSVSACWADGNRSSLRAIWAVAVLWAGHNTTVGCGAIRLATEALRAHLAVARVHEVAPIRVSSFRALDLCLCLATGGAYIAWIAEVALIGRHTCIRAVEGRRALVE